MSESLKPTRQHEQLLFGVALLIFLAMFAQFFGSTIWSGFRWLSGDAGDYALISVLHEHVYRSLLGHASLRNPHFYYPVPDILGYTDAFLLNQIFYLPLRLIGLSPLLAMQLTFMLLSLVGAAAFVCLLTRFLGVRLWLAVVAASIFAFSHSLYMKSIHPQHYAIYYLPLIACLFLTSLLSARSKTSVLLLAFTAGLLLGLTFATGYYMAWFFVFFLIFAIPLYAFLNWHMIRDRFRDEPARKQAKMSLAGSVIGFGLGALVVAWIYLPALGALKSLTRMTYLAQGATFRDIINVSDGNLMWGWLLRASHIIPLQRLQMTEIQLAVTPLLVIAVTTGTIVIFRRRHSSMYCRAAAPLCVAILFGYAMLYLFTITIHGTSLFFVIQKFVPGAIAIRVGFRSQVLSAGFMSLAFAVVAEAYLRLADDRTVGWHWLKVPARESAVLVVAAILALEQVDLHSLARLDRVQEEATLANTPPPPAECRVFAVYNDGSRMLQAIHTDAMRMSQRFDIPTVNGYSGGSPPRWDFGNVWEPSYLDKVRRWVRDNKVAGPLCLYDATVKRWRRIDQT